MRLPDAFQIEPVRSRADLDAVGRLFGAYAAALGVDLAFQGFEGELAGLPGRYAPPAGALLLARCGEGRPAGCVALRPIAPEGCCEMKRLYVVPGARGHGLGRRLVEAVIRAAIAAGHREMRLDTLPSMRGAARLYEQAGFVPIAPYYETPLAGTLFLSRPLLALSGAQPAAAPPTLQADENKYRT